MLDMAQSVRRRATVALALRLCKRVLLLTGISLVIPIVTVIAQADMRTAAPNIVPMGMLLRLHELPLGYVIGDDSSCGTFGADGAAPSMATFVRKYRPKACNFEYERIYRLSGQEPDLPLVGSIVINTPDDEAAEVGAGIAPELLTFLTGDEKFTEATSPVAIGNATWLFHTDQALVLDKSNQPGSILFWRYGHVLAGLYIAGRPLATDDMVAVQLARLQQAHIELPTSYTRSELDDTLVPLGNPRLRVPVYWLGRNFRPGNGLPTSSISGVFGPLGRGGGLPEQKLELEYTHDLHLDSWTRHGWKHYIETKLGRLVRTWPCTKSRVQTIRTEHAVIYAGYEKNFAKCPHKPPSVYFAQIYLGKMVVGINVLNCRACSVGRTGAYNSIHGMEAVVRKLRLNHSVGP
jgi:hypothetical protein